MTRKRRSRLPVADRAGLLPVLLLLAWSRPPFTARAADTAGGSGLQVELDLAGVPNFIFENEPVRLVIGLRRGRRFAAMLTGKERKEQRYVVTVTGADNRELGRRPLLVPATHAWCAPACFTLRATHLEPGAILHVLLRASGKSRSAGSVNREIRLLRPGKSVRKPRVCLDHFEDAEGRRVIFLVPRVDQGARRKWYPLRALGGGSATVGSVLLVGTRLGSGEYARRFAQMARKAHLRPLPPSLAPAGAGWPVYHLFVAALARARTATDVVILFPGIADIHAGTPLEEYRLVLHATMAVFDLRRSRPRRLLLAGPPPYFAAPARARAYAAAAAAVAEERGWDMLDLATAYPPPSSRDGGFVPLPLHPGEERQELLARKLLRAIPDDPGKSLMLLAGAGALLLASGALLWLYLYSRASVPDNGGQAEP